MADNYKTDYIDLENLVTISRGDTAKILKYLNQFKELIPDRLYLLKQALYLKDRSQIRQVLHKMSPQLQFFGIQNVAIPIQRLEFDYEIMPFHEMESLVKDIIHKLEHALLEVNATIVHFE